MNGRLIVNLGSRRVAWRGAGRSGVAAHSGVPERCLAQAFAKDSKPREVVIGSVASEETTRRLRDWCRESWDIAPRELLAAAEACGVHNAYADPERLGIDRWAALVAARKLRGGSALIADCGTAVSVDYLAGNGRHMGGLVAPGLGLMRAALGSGTRLELAREPAPAPVLFAADTESAVSGGTLGMIVAWLDRLGAQTTAQYGDSPALLITGGDVPAILGRLQGSWQWVPDLVLDGLEWLAEQAA